MAELTGIVFIWAETGTEGGYWAFQDAKFIQGNSWAYDGLHVLEDGDQLVIYNQDDQEVFWSGLVHLTKQDRAWGTPNHDASPDLVTVTGIVMHQAPALEVLDAWKQAFSKEYTARLEKRTHATLH